MVRAGMGAVTEREVGLRLSSDRAVGPFCFCFFHSFWYHFFRAFVCLPAHSHSRITSTTLYIQNTGTPSLSLCTHGPRKKMYQSGVIVLVHRDVLVEKIVYNYVLQIRFLHNSPITLYKKPHVYFWKLAAIALEIATSTNPSYPDSKFPYHEQHTIGGFKQALTLSL